MVVLIIVKVFFGKQTSTTPLTQIKEIINATVYYYPYNLSHSVGRT